MLPPSLECKTELWHFAFWNVVTNILEDYIDYLQGRSKDSGGMFFWNLDNHLYYQTTWYHMTEYHNMNLV
jgi:hypothetical protein